MLHLRQLRVQQHHHALRRVVAGLQAVTCTPPQAASEQTCQVELQALICTPTSILERLPKLCSAFKLPDKPLSIQWLTLLAFTLFEGGPVASTWASAARALRSHLIL